jgi:hypothetical protein
MVILANVFGLVMNLVGVILLFRYGMPFRVRTDGAITLITEQSNLDAVKIESLYTILGYVGLALIILGTLAQIVAALAPLLRWPLRSYLAQPVMKDRVSE